MARASATCALVIAAGMSTASAVEINQTLYGETLIEGISWQRFPLGQINRSVGDDADRPDGNESVGWMRAKLGAKIQIQDRVETNISLVYDAEAGAPSEDGIAGSIHLNDANVLLRRFIFPDLHLRIGRQPVSYNLRKGRGGFLYDSRANNPAVTSWDGVRAHYNWDTLTFQPYTFLLSNDETSVDGTNTLSGVHVDWQPDGIAGDGRVFVTGSLSLERNLIYDNRDSDNPQVGDRIMNYYIGLEWERPNGWTFWGEGAFQEGRLDSDRKFRGYGLSAGVEWDVPGNNNAIVGVQVDHRSGDRNPEESGRYTNFVAPHEGVSDTRIMEHERYGELTNLLVGNTQALKVSAEYKFDQFLPRNPLHLKFVWGYFQMDKAPSGYSSFLGNEFDLSMGWQYGPGTTINVFGAVFRPGRGMEQLINDAYTDSTRGRTMYMLGTNLQVNF